MSNQERTDDSPRHSDRECLAVIAVWMVRREAMARDLFAKLDKVVLHVGGAVSE